MKLEKTQCIYVIFNPELNITKIGISDNAEKRKKGLEASCGCELVLHYHTNHVFNAIKYEMITHEKLAEHRRVGEWFNITPEIAAEVVKTVIADAVSDPIIGAYLQGTTITKIAEEYHVTRQAIISRLKEYGFRTNTDNIVRREKNNWRIYSMPDPVPPKPQIPKTPTPTPKSKPIELPENTYLDEIKPSLPLQRLKRLEANINYNGDWYQISTYIAGEFKYAYTQDILKARAYRESMK